MVDATNDNRVSKPCPICGKPSRPETRPFCSKRCADVDLHRWLRGSYAVPVADGNVERADDTDDDSGS